jgi:hypothetical protein
MASKTRMMFGDSALTRDLEATASARRLLKRPCTALAKMRVTHMEVRDRLEVLTGKTVAVPFDCDCAFR